MSPSKDIKLDLNFKVSPEFSCVLIKGIVEYLLYYRHQIPFNFELFEKLIKNKKEEEANCFKKLKLLNLARHTYEGICGIKTLIENELTTARSIYLIFGKTLFTSLEAYEIMLPSHSSKSASFINETATLKKILLQLIQNENLRYKQLSATNIYFLFNRPIAIDSSDLIELRNFKLNRSCHKYRISFRDVSGAFEIFQDEFNMLNLSDENQQTEKELEQDNNEDEEIKCVWYQSKIFVKGFDALKNDSIWT